MERKERIIPGHFNQRSGETTSDTKIIDNPVHADFYPWLGRKHTVVHIMHPYGSMSGYLRRYDRGVMTVRAHDMDTYHLSYVTFSAADVSEINITGSYGPTIWLRKERSSR